MPETLASTNNTTTSDFKFCFLPFARPLPLTPCCVSSVCVSVQVWFCEEYNIMIIFFFEVLCIHFC